MSKKKDAAVTFLKMAAMGDVRAAYDRFIAPHFIHHNPYFKGDRASLLRAMEEAHQASPNKSFEVKQIVEEDDRVVTYSLVTRKAPDGPSIAVVHLFRFEGDQVVELWDVGQMINKDSPNENGPF